MGKRITQQARGKGSLTFRVRKRAYRYRIGYPMMTAQGNAKIIKIINSSAHSAPLAKIKIGETIFFSPVAEGLYEGQEIQIITGEIKSGNIMKLKDIPIGTKIFNIENAPGSGGKFARSAGTFAIINTKDTDNVIVLINKKKINLNGEARATIGTVSGDGRKMKPMIKAGKKHHMMLAKGRKWHRTSAIKVNAVDHPFGSGRGKRIKSKIAKRNAPAGAKVGHIRPRRTGKQK